MARRKKYREETLFDEWFAEQDVIDLAEAKEMTEAEIEQGLISFRTSSNVIKNAGNNQHELLYNIMMMHNNGKPFDCDCTYSIGNFYGSFNMKKADGTTVAFNIPQPKYKFDVYPQTPDTVKIEPLTKLPLEDESIESIVIDLPFVVSCGPSIGNGKKDSNMTVNRFSCFYPVSELYKTYFFWINEAFRVLKKDGTLVWKCQSTVSGGINHNIEEFSVMCADKVGFVCEEKAILLAKARVLSGKVKKQAHFRKYTSVFYVFKKWKSKKYKRFNMGRIVDNLYNDFNNPDIYR